MWWGILMSATWYACCLVGISSMYQPVERLLSKQYPAKFESLSTNSQSYCAKNVIKSAVLSASIPATVYVMTLRLITGRWSHTTFARGIGSLYAANDVVALYRVTLPANTRIHHACVFVFSLCNLFLDYNDETSIFTNLGILCGLSMLPCTVNAYLGLRKLTDASALALFGLLTYVPAFAMNLAWQTAAVIAATMNGDTTGAICWGGLCGMIFYDDLVLIDHLITVVGERRPQPGPNASHIEVFRHIVQSRCAELKRIKMKGSQ